MNLACCSYRAIVLGDATFSLFFLRISDSSIFSCLGFMFSIDDIFGCPFFEIGSTGIYWRIEADS